MTQQEPPKIEFPCHYSIRVMGDAHESFVDTVFELIYEHAPEIKREDVKTKDSRHGRYMSVHVVIYATGVEQLEAIHLSLQSYESVKMVI